MNEHPPEESRVLLLLGLVVLIVAGPVLWLLLGADEPNGLLIAVSAAAVLTGLVCFLMGVWRAVGRLDWLVDAEVTRQRAEQSARRASRGEERRGQ